MPNPTISCPQCLGRLRVRDESRWGTRVRCPNCHHSFVAQKPSGGLEPALPDSAPAPAPFVPVVPEPEPSATLPLRSYRRRQRRQRNLAFLAGGLIAVVIVGAGWWFVSQGSRPNAVGSWRSLTGGKSETVAKGSDRPDQSSVIRADDAAHVPAKEQRIPISLKYAPAGSSLLIHLHPARLWAKDARHEEFRRCLEPLVGWGEEAVKQVCPFEPPEIEQALFCVVFRAKEAPADLAAILHFANDYDPAAVRKKFPGRERAEKDATLIVGDTWGVLLVDARTLAVAPATLADEMLDALSDNAITAPAIDGLLSETDAGRDVTFIFQPDELRDRARYVVSNDVFTLLDAVCLWLTDFAEAAAFSVRLGDPFSCELVIRNRQASERSSTTSAKVASLLRHKLESIPGELVSAMKEWQPQQSGTRRLIGRFPAMMKAVATIARHETGPHWIRLSTTLPERAAPNLALGGMLAWREWTRPRQPGSPSVLKEAAHVPNANESQTSPAKNDSLAAKLNKPIDVDFRRTPLEEAFIFIGEQTGVKFTLDGKALEAAGFTRNMPQEFKAAGQPALAVVARILKQYDRMVIVLDEQAGTATVMTEAAAREKGQTPLQFDPPKTP